MWVLCRCDLDTADHSWGCSSNRRENLVVTVSGFPLATERGVPKPPSEKPCSKRQGFCSTADGVTSNPIGIPNQLMLMRLSYPQLGRVLFTAPSPYRNVARPGLADRRAMTSQCWTITGGGRICTEDISKKKTPFHLYLTKVLPKVKKES